MVTGGVTLTWILIAALSTGVGGTLFGWVYTGHKANCERASRAFMQKQVELGTQGPINECIR